MTPEIQKLLQVIEHRLNWGPSAEWQSRDFDSLQQLILDETGVSLSASTLKRVWGRVQYGSAPSGVTLDTLARFAGFASHRAFLVGGRGPVAGAASSVPDVRESAAGSGPRGNGAGAAGPMAASAQGAPLMLPARWAQFALTIGIVLILAIVAILAFRRRPPHPRGPYRFSSHTVVTRGVPNSVVFSYDAPVNAGDSVFIVQSWDWTRREPVDPDGRLHTSIYYHPGFFQAKLVVDTSIVMTHLLMIATDGWLGMVENEPIPVYLKPTEFLTDTLMRLPLEAVSEKAPFTQAHPPKVRFYNVGNFDPVPVPNLSFSAEIRNDYGQGAAACRGSKIYLITNDGYGTILIPLSMKGCISDLSVSCVDHGLSGKDADLSGFGLDSPGWASVACRSTGRDIRFFVNEHLACTLPLPSRASGVVGIEFVFQGTGSVRHVRLSNNDHIVLQAF